MKPFLLSLLNPTNWTITGLIITMVGVLLLFRFGMPYRLRPAKGDYVITESATKDRWDGMYSILSWFGLVAIFIGTACQIFGAYLG